VLVPFFIHRREQTSAQEKKEKNEEAFHKLVRRKENGCLWPSLLPVLFLCHKIHTGIFRTVYENIHNTKIRKGKSLVLYFTANIPVNWYTSCVFYDSCTTPIHSMDIGCFHDDVT
jgi:hypothetical protein